MSEKKIGGASRNYVSGRGRGRGNNATKGRGRGRGKGKGRRFPTITLTNKFIPNVTYKIEVGNKAYMRRSTLRRAKSASRDILYELLTSEPNRLELVDKIKRLLFDMPFPAHIEVLASKYKEDTNDFYVNFDNNTHLSIHHNRENGGEKGHIHVTDETSGLTIRIAIFVDNSLDINIIGLCYNETHQEDLQFIGKVCAAAIKQFLDSHTSKIFTIKKICIE